MGAPLRIADAGFFDSVRHSRKILLIVFGGLGDIVHQVPALRSVRLNFPDARIEVLTPAGGADILRGLEGIDRVIPHFGRQAGWNWSNLKQFWELFRARYDLCIDFWGSNHSSLVALTTAAPARLGRRPSGESKIGWRICPTHVAIYPYLLEPMYVQWTSMLEQLGFRVDRQFVLKPDPERFAATGIAPGLRGRYIHLSPNAGDPARELALPLLAQVVDGLARALPDHPLVISNAATPRQQQYLQDLLGAIRTPPLRVFAGSLDIRGLMALIQNAALHLSADSGPVHLAVAAGTPSVSWFLKNPGMLEYLPEGARHFAFVVDEPRGGGISGIAAEDIVARCVEKLRRAAAIPAGTDPAPAVEAG